MTYTYALTPGDVVSDDAGNTVGGWRIDLYDARTGGTKITDVQDLSGNPLPGYLTTNSEGRYEFQRVDETIPVLWADDGQSGQRWALLATEVGTAAANVAADADAAAASATAAQQSASDAADSAAAAASSATSAVSTANSALTEIDNYKNQTPTLEELVFSCYVPAITNSTGVVKGSEPYGIETTLFVAPGPIKIHSVALAWDYYSLAASNTDYWSVTVRRLPGNGDPVQTLGTRTTQTSGTNSNGGISTRKAWSFSGIDLSATTFAENDMLGIGFDPVGSPPDIVFGYCATIRYSPA